MWVKITNQLHLTLFCSVILCFDLLCSWGCVPFLFCCCWCTIIIIILYSAILCSRADSLRICRMWFWTSDYLLSFFIAHIINSHGSGVLVALCGCCMAGVSWNAAALLITTRQFAPQSYSGGLPELHLMKPVVLYIRKWSVTRTNGLKSGGSLFLQ